jgi:D-alanyl-D-alanine carboxypeptidase/D-alanyl-D-alanine-endopeptidase (penicillin-binding protein 4)
MKLVTAVAVLDALGPDARVRTRVVVDTDTSIPRVVVVGAGDPSLVSAKRRVGSPGSSLRPASMEELATSTARGLALRGITEVRVGYDASLFTGAALHPSWSPSFPAAGIVAPVSALVVDQGRWTPEGISRVSDPAAEAGRTFAASLRAAGVTVKGQPKEVTAPEAAVTVAFVESPTVGALVERMVAASDNDYAEILGRLAAAASGAPASFAGVADHAEHVLDALGIAAGGARFADGSGLSRGNRLAPSTLTDLLLVTSDGFGSMHSGLPVAGATGSLAARFLAPDQQPARGVVRAKTGTLTGVGGLAGYISRPDGRLLAFGFVDDSAPGGLLGVRAALDRATAVLVTCDCAAP